MKLEDRLRRAGDLLDAASTEYERAQDRSATGRAADRPPRRPGPRLVLAAALLTAVVAAGSIVVLSRGDRPTNVSTGTERDGTIGEGVVLLTDTGLVHPDTGAEEPLTQVEQGYFASGLATPGPGGDRVYYNSWRSGDELPVAEQGPMADGRPSVRVKDLTDGSDTVVADGARTVAVDRHGRIAFGRGVHPNDDITYRYPSDVLVQDSPDAEPHVWSSEPGEYLVSAWAGDRVLAARWDRPNQMTDIVVLDGPGRQRTLARHAVLLALSPDGTTALVDRDEGPDGQSGRWRLELVDVATGTARTVDLGRNEVSMAAVDDRPLTVGSWVGDTVVVTTLVLTGVRNLVFRVDGGTAPTLTLQRAFDTPMEHADVPAVWLQEDGSTFEMLVRTSTPHTYRLLRCTVATGACPGRELPVRAEVVVARLRNPSRPLPPGLPVEAS